MHARARSFHPVMFRSLWAYRGFVIGTVRREYTLRYRGSLLGILWAVLNPLAQILVFTLIFAELMKARLPGHEGSAFGYGIYVCAGIIPWALFSETVSRMTTVFLENANLIKKANFPRITLPVTVVLATLTNFAIIASIFLAFLLATGRFPGAVVLTAIAPLAVLVVFASALGLLLGTVNVFFRDVAHFVGIVLVFWFWLTPIIYLVETVPPRAQALLSINPMTPIVQAFQQIFLHARAPAWEGLAVVALFAIALLWLAGAMFVRLVPEIVDEL